MVDISPFRDTFPETRISTRDEATDAVGECCISLLRQDKARQAKTGQDCLFVSPAPPLRGAKTGPTVPTSCPERVARRIGRTLSKKRGQRGCVRGTARGKADCERAGRNEDEKGLGGERCRVWKRGRMKLEETLSRDNEAAHECRNEWVLFTIANSGPSGLPRPASRAPANTRRVATTITCVRSPRRTWPRENRRPRERPHCHVRRCILIFNSLAAPKLDEGTKRVIYSKIFP